MNDKGIPVVKKRVVQDDWQVSFYDEFEAVLFPAGKLHKKLEQLIDFTVNRKVGSGFRREVVLDAYPFLCAVRPEEKAIYIGTRRLSRELALQKIHEINPVLIDKDIEKLFFQYPLIS